MTDVATQSIDTLTPAWRELETRSPVNMRAIENDKHHRAMVDFMNQLLDAIGDRRPIL